MQNIFIYPHTQKKDMNEDEVTLMVTNLILNSFDFGTNPKIPILAVDKIKA